MARASGWSALTSTRLAYLTPKPAHWGQCAPPSITSPTLPRRRLGQRYVRRVQRVAGEGLGCDQPADELHLVRETRIQAVDGEALARTDRVMGPAIAVIGE